MDGRVREVQGYTGIQAVSIPRSITSPPAHDDARLNSSITLEDFQFIFSMEWGHRILGRLIGITFVVPLAYFTLKKRITTTMSRRMLGLSLLIGAQGAMGWYMVKSGLEDSIMDTPGAVPRVSQYRLASHLGLAFLLYLGMFGTGMSVIKDWKFANGAAWSGVANANIANILQNPIVKRVKTVSWTLTGLVLLTAISGTLSPSRTYGSRTKLIKRRICCWLGCGPFVQRVPTHGWSIGTPSRRTLRPCICKGF